MNSLVRFVRGLAALVLVLAIVVGAPLVLVRVGRFPDPDAFADVFARDNGTLLLAVLTVVGWAAWAVFTGSILVEAVSLLSGRRLGVRLPGLTAPRGLAAGLLLTIAAMLPLQAHAQPAPTVPAPEAQDRDQHGIEEWLPRESARHESARHESAGRESEDPGFRYTVRRGDDLWSLAERFYGDGLAWSRIVAANPLITSPDEIDVGWELVLPGVAEPTRPAAGETAHEGVPSAPHDGPPPMSPAPSTSPAPPQLETDPVEANAASEPAEDPMSSIDLAAYLTAGISSLVAAALLGRLATRRATQLTNRAAGRRIVHPAPRAQRLEAALGRTQDPLSLRILDLGLRALAQHYREADERLPSLVAVLVEEDRVILEVDRVPDRLPPGFHGEGHRLWLGRSEGEVLEARAHDLVGEPAPYPALVCLGETAEGSLLLMDLESLGMMGVTGSPMAVSGLLNALVLELSSSWWGHGQSVVVIDGDAEFVSALDDPSVEHHTDLDAVLTTLEREARGRSPVRAEAHPRDVRSEPDFTEAWRPHVVLIGRRLTDPERRRVGPLIDEAHVVVVAADPDLPGVRVMPSPAWSTLPNGHTFRAQTMTARSREDLIRLLQATGTRETTPAPWWSEPVPPPSPRDRDASVPARSAGLARPAHAPPNWESDGATILSLAARRAAVTAEEPAVDSHEPVLHPTHPTVLLVGPVDLIATRGERPTRAARQCVEYAAWLLEHPGATATMMASALFVAEGTRRSNMSRLRTWLGSDDDGDRYLPEAYSGRIRLHAEVTSDWHHVQLLVIGGVDRASDENLMAVLRLVRGAPLADAAPGQWHWAEELRTDIASLIRDVGLVLSERALDRGQVDLARWAVGRALVAAPEDERLLAARVRTEHRAGNVSEVERLALRLVRSARKLNVDLADDTVTLLQEVMEGRPRTRGLG